jgi:acyl-CoA dehydrogenase
MDALSLPRPGWMTEDLVLLEEQARRFIASEYVPHLDAWNGKGMYEREVWTKAGAAGLLCPAIPEEYGGAGGSFAHEAVIGRELSLAGFDSFGAPLHSGIVAPYILHYGTDEQKRRWLPKLVTGELVGAIAMSEPAPAPTCKASAPRPRSPAAAMCSTSEDVHHQRPACQPDRRGRQDRRQRAPRACR